MIYGADAPVALPVIDLYDTGMMKMYVDAAKEQYQQGLKDYETFMSKYGDFTSPFKKDVDWWDKNVMGPVVNKINEYYARGIDPTRNPEARADIQRAVRSVPRTAAAQRKANATRGEVYLKELGKLAAQGKFDRDQNNFYLQLMGYPLFEDFSTEDYGTWGLESPVEAKSLFDTTSSWFAGMKPHDMTKEQVIDAMGEDFYDPNKTYTGIPEQDLYEVVKQRIPGWLDTFEGKFFKENAKQRLIAAGYEPTEDNINELLYKDIVTANHAKVIDPIGELDPIKKMDIELRNQKALDDYKAANEIKVYDAKRAADINYYNQIHPDDDDDASGSGDINPKTGRINIFREAELSGHPDSILGKDHAEYDSGNELDELITPVNHNIRASYDDNGGMKYIIPTGGSGRGIIWTTSSVYGENGENRLSYVRLDPDKSYTFHTTGKMHARELPSGKMKYFVSGILYDDLGNKMPTKDGRLETQLEVKEQLGVYVGKKDRELSKNKKKTK